jgi:hypothetical protein
MIKKFNLLTSIVLGTSTLIAGFSSLPSALAQDTPPPNLPSAMYNYQDNIYYWNKSQKTTCHIVNPVQHRIFIKKGVPSRSSFFTPYNYQGDCLWPQGVYEPPKEGKALYINSRKEICHIPTPALHSMLAQKFGVNESSSSSIISKGLRNIGICPTPE